MKKTLHVNVPAPLSSAYSILIAPELLQSPQQWLNEKYKNIVIITDDRVKKKYGLPLLKLLEKKDRQVLLLSFRAGEQSKTSQTKAELEQKILQHQFGRDTLIMALGGGVVGDLAGFIAATYMRGVPYIQIPTTLLAMVDSSIGGKTSIDTPQGKNLIGAFWQPRRVIVDIHCLQTLNEQQIINGLIEALKMFLTNDAISFNFFIKKLEKILQKEKKALGQLIYRAIKIKTFVIEEDEREENMRRVLNFGHTIGHALETLTDYQLLHGVAVGYGILVEAKIAELLGLLKAKHYDLIESVFARLNINAHYLKKFNIEKIIQATYADKKTKKGKVYYVLLQDIGKVYEKDKQFAHPVDNTIVKKAWGQVIRGR